jgi:hypothetical protein
MPDEKIQESAWRDEPDALVLSDLQKIGIPRDHERGASLNRRRDVLVVIPVGAYAGDLVFSGNHLRQDEDVLEPELGFSSRSSRLHDLWVGERVEDLRGDLGRQHELEGRVTQEPLNDLPRRTFRSDVSADVHISVKDGAEHRRLLRLRARLSQLPASPALRLQAERRRLLVGEGAAFLPLQDVQRMPGRTSMVETLSTIATMIVGLCPVSATLKTSLGNPVSRATTRLKTESGAREDEMSKQLAGVTVGRLLWPGLPNHLAIFFSGDGGIPCHRSTSQRIAAPLRNNVSISFNSRR